VAKDNASRSNNILPEDILFSRFSSGANDDSSGTSGFCSVRIRNRGRSATKFKAIQSGYILREIWRAGLGTNQDLLLQLR
jgi:hypothetical protein